MNSVDKDTLRLVYVVIDNYSRNISCICSTREKAEKIANEEYDSKVVLWSVR